MIELTEIHTAAFINGLSRRVLNSEPAVGHTSSFGRRSSGFRYKLDTVGQLLRIFRSPHKNEFIVYVRLYAVQLHPQSRQQQVQINVFTYRYLSSIDVQTAVVFVPWLNKGGRKPDKLLYAVQDTDLPYRFPYTI